jgi:hypothetical protein
MPGGVRVADASRLVLALLFASGATGRALAQSVASSAPPAPTRPIAHVSVDLAARAFDRVLPFDVPFFITGRAPQGTSSVDVQYAVVPKSGDAPQLFWMPSAPARWQPDAPASTEQTFLVLVGTPLSPGRRYRFRFAITNERTADTTATADGRTDQKNYVSVDAGFVYAGTIDTGALYVGSNIYFRPINKSAPLTAGSGIRRRLALTVGLTISSLADEAKRTRSDLFWTQSLVLGAGLRLASSIRCGAGALVFRESDPNPLVTRTSAAATWYVSFSFDLDLLKGFAG